MPPGVVINWNTIHVPLVDSVLVLYRSYPGDPGLQDYLKAAIKDGTLPVSIFVSTLLQAARSPELHIPATLDRQVFDTFIMSLTLLIGDDAKATREAQMMHTIQLILGKGDILGLSSDTDTVTLGLLMKYMVCIVFCMSLLLRFSLLPVIYLPPLLPQFQIAYADAIFWLVTERLPTGHKMHNIMAKFRTRLKSKDSDKSDGRQLFEPGLRQSSRR